MNGKRTTLPRVPSGQDPLTFYREMRHDMLKFHKWNKVGKNDYDRQVYLLRKIGQKLYELTGNEIYLR